MYKTHVLSTSQNIWCVLWISYPLLLVPSFGYTRDAPPFSSSTQAMLITAAGHRLRPTTIYTFSPLFGSDPKSKWREILLDPSPSTRRCSTSSGRQNLTKSKEPSLCTLYLCRCRVLGILPTCPLWIIRRGIRVPRHTRDPLLPRAPPRCFPLEGKSRDPIIRGKPRQSLQFLLEGKPRGPDIYGKPRRSRCRGADRRSGR